ncbi:MAG: DUF4232 domain-containing protein [Streptosporangiaceae bacterium]
MHRHRSAPTLLMGFLLLAAGCGGAGGASAEAPTSPAPTMSSTGMSASPTPSGPPSSPGRVAAPPESPVPATPSPSRAHDIARCTTAVLDARLGRNGGAAGHVRYDFVFRNTGAERCAIKGFTRVVLIGHRGKVLDVTNSHKPSVVVPKVPVRRIVLRPGDAASFSVGYADVPRDGQNCPVVRATKVRLYPPHSSRAQTVDARPSPCRHVVHISPVVAGAAGASP